MPIQKAREREKMNYTLQGEEVVVLRSKKLEIFLDAVKRTRWKIGGKDELRCRRAGPAGTRRSLNGEVRLTSALLFLYQLKHGFHN